MPLPPELQGQSWTQRTARNILPLLVHRAEAGSPITYGELDQEVVKRGWGDHAMVVNYGRPLGIIGDLLERTASEWAGRIPPLNALVVNATTSLPGNGCDYYLEHFVHQRYRALELTMPERRALVQETHQAVYSFAQWSRVLEEYGLNRVTVETVSQVNDTKWRPNTEGETYGRGGPESEAHKRLKEYVANNPCAVGLDASWTGSVEYRFMSGDTADVLMRQGMRALAIEVKSADASDREQTRGVFQCVKYQALLRAEQRMDGFPPVGRATLVTGRRLGDEPRDIANALGILVFEDVTPTEA